MINNARVVDSLFLVTGTKAENTNDIKGLCINGGGEVTGTGFCWFLHKWWGEVTGTGSAHWGKSDWHSVRGTQFVLICSGSSRQGIHIQR